MRDIPDPPAGSRIRVEREHSVVVLDWRARPWDMTPGRHVLDTVRTTAATILAVGWILWMAGSIIGAIQLGNGFLFPWLAGIPFIWAVRDNFRRRKRFRPTERLVLGEDTLFHTPSARRAVPPYLPPEEGSERARPGGADAPPPSHTWPSAFVGRQDAGDVRLAGKGVSEIIAFASAKGELTIGRRLSHADREWLVEVLNRWKESQA